MKHFKYHTKNLKVSTTKLTKRSKMLLFAGTFGVIGATALLIANAATPTIHFEAESSTISGNTSVFSDTAASGGSYVEFTESNNSSGAMPTKDTTGPRYSMIDISPSQFFSSRSCNKQRIVGNVDFNQSWMKGQTFTLTDCEITGRVYIYITGGAKTLSLTEMPTINIDYVDILGGIFTLNATKITINHSYINGGGQWSVKDVWAPFISAEAPYTVSNSVFYNIYKTQPAHTEALHVGDYGVGYKFVNVVFEQQGGSLQNSGVTATINFHGDNALFDGCWFIFDGPIPSYFTAYLDAKNSIVRNSYFEGTSGSYVYPDSPYLPRFENNYDFTTGQSITL